MIKVLFICHGNICRSPMAEYLMKKEVADRGLSGRFHIQSAGTSTEEWGNPVYPPVRRFLASKGISCSEKRAVQVSHADISEYDYLICMERTNLRNLYRMFPKDTELLDRKAFRLLEFSVKCDRNDAAGDIEDPWYSGDFDTVEKQISEGIVAFLDKILRE